LASDIEGEIAGTSLDWKNKDSEEASTISKREAVFRMFHNAADVKDNESDNCAATSFREHALKNWGLSADEYGSAMSEARKSWISEGSSGGGNGTSWIDAHGFYRGSCEAVGEFLKSRGNEDVYVITTKAKEFALRLLEKQNLYQSNADNQDGESPPSATSFIKESQVYGLGSGPKASVLQQILEACQAKEDASNNNNNSDGTPRTEYVAVMVEDNVATLDRISKSLVGEKVMPVVASWGYNSNEQLVDVLLSTKTMDKQQNHYVVLPLLTDSARLSARENAKTAGVYADRAKSKDPTGCSLASILLTPFDAGSLMANTGKDKDEAEQNTDDSYDFVSNVDIPQLYFQQKYQTSQC